MNKINKAVFPVAGFGTQFSPATKAMLKELLPIVIIEIKNQSYLVEDDIIRHEDQYARR